MNTLQDIINRTAEITGVHPVAIRTCMIEIPTTDAMLAAHYYEASCLAVNVKSDRHSWNLRRAKQMMTIRGY